MKPLAILLALCALAPWSGLPAALRAGAAASNITPHLGTSLDGPISRNGLAVQVHDELHARCLVLDDGTTRLAIVVCDCTVIGRPVIDAAKAIVAERCGLPGDRVLVSATHTHATPRSLPGLTDNPLNAGYEQFLARRIAQGINEIFIHGLSVDHHGGNGVNLVECYEDPRVSDSILTYNAKAGLRIQAGHDIVVTANHFEENQDAVHCLDSFNLCMSGNNIDDHLDIGVIIENTYGSVLSGNMIEECQGTGIILDRDCYGITLSANVIAHEMGGGIDLRDAWGCAVSANTFTIVHKFSLRIGPGSGRIAVTGNVIADTGRRTKDREPIDLGGAKESIVENNAISP